ncbi:MAG: hypothetical protein IPM57_09780 [Oligoflexia bacterium]|nr:hypothetical protein [Oligoflexia bacterium]
MSVNFLIGHRGVGKTSLLKRIQYYIPEAYCIDLDQKIKDLQNSTIENIFTSFGQEYFRNLEIKTLEDVLKSIDTSKPVFIALGAGFKLESLKNLKEKNILWVKRVSDKFGRIFFDRPLLNKNSSPLKDYLDLFNQRENTYSNFYTECLVLPEGSNEPNGTEENFFQNKINVQNASITLLPEHFRNFHQWINKRLSWNFKYFEVRTDLLTKTQIDEALKIIPEHKILLSYRTNTHTEFFKTFNYPNGMLTDWPLELGAPPFKVDYVSLHSLTKPLDETLNILSARKEKIKLSININNFSDLLKCHDWFLKDTKSRVFLPRGDFGLWYRLLIYNTAEINFIREDCGSSSEQPTLLQWLNTQNNGSGFYAVLGDPIEHSYSPYFHKNLNKFLPIKLKKENFQQGINALTLLGLKGAAVTSPLKELAFNYSTFKTPLCEKLRSANTLLINNQKIMAHNTDYESLNEILIKFKNVKSIAVWGGGGVLSSILSILPQAICYSASSAKPRNLEGDIKNFSPEIVIWAASNANKPLMPEKSWQPRIVFDLNYSDSSLGREYALNTKSEYISGLEMFKLQAKKQLNFWTQNECK